MSEVGQRLRNIRKSKNLRLKDVAKAAGIAQSSLSYIENGTNMPTIDTLERIIGALGMTTNDFFSVYPTAEEVIASYEVLRIMEKIQQLPPEKLKILESVLDTWVESN